MANVSSFGFVARRDARVLILGSMPGVASLEAQQYYAHPRNAFWPIVGELCGFDPALPYRARLTALRRAGVALWDVLARCEREGSLDSDIAAASMEPNDFAAFFTRHRLVAKVFCNGGTAHRLFTRRVRPTLPAPARGLPVALLPSTSPAHASRTFAEKRDRWFRELRPWLS